MALEYGFYNSTQALPRKYDAEQFSRLFDGLIKDGVFQNIGNHLQVSATTGLTVAIGTGRAWFNHTWTYLSSAITLTHDANNTLLDRIDAVVLDIDSDVNAKINSFQIVKGPTNSTLRPSLEHTETHNQYPLAYVLIPSQASAISNANITNAIGTTECPFVTGILSTLDASTLYAQWAASFNDFLTASDATFDQFMDSLWVPSSQEEYTQLSMHVSAMGVVRNATFDKDNWTETASGSDIYTQTVSVTGMDAAYNPFLVSVLPSNATAETAATYNNDFSIMASGRGVTTSNSVTWYCYGGKPNGNITVGLRGE